MFATSKATRNVNQGNVIFQYRKISDVSISTLYLKNKPNTALEVKTDVAKSLGIDTDQIDVINKAVILRDDQNIPTNDDVTEVMIHRKYRRIPLGKRTSKEDMFEGSMADGSRVEMSCGHATTPENLYRYCLSKLNSCDLGFTCTECGTTWEFTEISTKADMSDDECVFFSRKMNDVYIDESDDIRHCPKCKSYCSRVDTGNKWVNCTVCSKSGTVFQFCWDCYESYTSNHSCARKLTQELLDNCERVTMAHSNIPNVPKVRACPNCKIYLEHDGGCKTMDCRKCKHTFCFSCLKPTNTSGVLQCGLYSSKCVVAPIQIV